MKLSIILSTKHTETNWNALRLANTALKKGDKVSVFLVGEGVEYLETSSEQFNVKTQIDKFLQSDQAQVLACGTCMKNRQMEETKECPINGMEDLYNLIAESDKVLTF